jgi:uncharacterized protein YcnI
MLKSGWQIDVKRGAYAKSYSYFHGAKFDQGVKEVTWSGGKLPDAFYDEFVLSTFIAGDMPAGQTLYFPIIQECEKGAHRWVEMPATGRADTEGDPAPGVLLVPKN